MNLIVISSRTFLSKNYTRVQIGLVLSPEELHVLFRSNRYKLRGPESVCLMPKEKCGLTDAAAHCPVGCSACQCNDKLWILFPWMSVSWDEVWLMSDLSWAARRDCCQQLQSDGQQKGSDVPLDSACYQGGTSVPGVWCCVLLQFAPLGTSELGQRQPDASPARLSQLDRGGRKPGKQPASFPTRLQVYDSPPSDFASCADTSTTTISNGGGSNWGYFFDFLAINIMCHWPRPASSWQGPSLQLGACYCPYAKVP